MFTSDDVCCNIRNVKFIKVMHFKQMFVSAVCVLFLLRPKHIKKPHENFQMGEGVSKRTFCGGGMDILWNYTLKKKTLLNKSQAFY